MYSNNIQYVTVMSTIVFNIQFVTIFIGQLRNDDIYIIQHFFKLTNLGYFNNLIIDQINQQEF